MSKPNPILDAAAGGSAFHRRPGIARHGLGPAPFLPEGEGHDDDAAAAAAKADADAKAAADAAAEKAKADAHDKAVDAARSDADKAVDAAREEGRKAAGRDANEKAATAILRASLKARGKTDEQVTTLVAATNVGAFLTDDDVDTDKVAAFANDIAGPVTGGGSRGPDHGQGTRGSSTRATGVSAGADMFEASRKKQNA